MVTQDDRSPEERKTHNWAVIGTDRFLSGWGQAEGGASYAAWACEDPRNDGELDHVLRWVQSRKEMMRVRVVDLDEYRPNPRLCAHFHIYVVRPGHPASSRKAPQEVAQ